MFFSELASDFVKLCMFFLLAKQLGVTRFNPFPGDGFLVLGRSLHGVPGRHGEEVSQPACAPFNEVKGEEWYW